MPCPLCGEEHIRWDLLERDRKLRDEKAKEARRAFRERVLAAAPRGNFGEAKVVRTM